MKIVLMVAGLAVMTLSMLLCFDTLLGAGSMPMEIFRSLPFGALARLLFGVVGIIVGVACIIPRFQKLASQANLLLLHGGAP